MNRTQTSFVALALAAALAACGDQTPAQPAPDGTTPSDSMPLKDGAATAAPTATGSGVVTAIDKAAGTITIQHGPIPAVRWPAMTMAFKADPPSLLDQVKVGDKVSFEMTTQGNQVTTIRAE